MKKLSMWDFEPVKTVGEHEFTHLVHEDEYFIIHLTHTKMKGNDGRYSRTLYWYVTMFPLDKDIEAIEFFHKNPMEVMDWVKLNRELHTNKEDDLRHQDK